MRDRKFPEKPPKELPEGRVTSEALKSNYGLFNRNNVYIRSWSWNYRGCWHQTCPPIVTQQCVLDTIHCILRPKRPQVYYFSSLPRYVLALGNLRACC